MPYKISVVIPSAPDRSTENIVTNLQKVRPPEINLEIIIIKGTHPPVQRNMGIQKSTGGFIFLFDDDVIIPAGTFEKVLGIFSQNPKVDVVGGPNLTPTENSFLQHCFGYAHASHFTGLSTAVRYYPAKQLRKINGNHLISCNLAFRSKILKENPFHAHIFPNEENELLGRLLRKGHTLTYSPEFIVHHHRRKTLGAYIKQILNWGIGRSIHTRARIRHFKPAFFMPLLFLLYLLSLIWYRPWWYVTPLILYGFLDLIFSLQTAFRHRNWKTLLVMPWLFPMTHLSYAFGLLIGLFKPLVPRKNMNEKDFSLTIHTLP